MDMNNQENYISLEEAGSLKVLNLMKGQTVEEAQFTIEAGYGSDGKDD